MPLTRTNRFARLSDTELSKFTGKTITGFIGNTDLPEPPVIPAQLTPLKATFDQAVIKADKGGPLATAQKNAARADLVDALNKDRSYVDIN